MFAYCITCKTTGKQYIGITSMPKTRFTDHGRANSFIGNAIRKYGKENFEMSILVEGEDRYIAELEPQLILSYGSLHPTGYNLSLQTQTSFKHHEISKEKMRKPKSESACANMSKAKKGKPGPTRKGMKKLRIYKVKTPDGIFNSVKEASEFYKIGQSAIYQRCSKVLKSFQDWEAIKEN